jgi:predicted ArsR family transcriptional regulator
VDETDARAGRPRRNRLPRNRRRERILQLVREYDGAVDAIELASVLGLHVTTVRFHLDALCDEGVITRTKLQRPGAGRPRTGYQTADERVDYRVLAEILAMQLGQTEETRARRAEDAGRKWSARLLAAQDSQPDDTESIDPADANDALQASAIRATEVFRRMGFDPELVTVAEPATRSSADIRQERVIQLHACPVRELARSYPEVACAVHAGLLQGLLTNPPVDGRRRKTQRLVVSARLEPLVGPELCIARLAAM